jgi:pimeloyl-ACP methyl ester carboxylesterase
VIAGHSAGGQLALLFAATYPADTAGVALLDSYSDAAIALQWMNAKNVTVNLPDGTTVTRPDVTRMTAATGASDLLRVVTPLAWSRFITMKPATSSWLAAMNAAYGSNKVWHSQWVELLSMAQPTITPLADELSKRSGRARFWNGVSWPSLGAKPVLLLPAAKTLNLPAGCDPATLATDTACQAKVAADAKNYYANLYLVYKDTLGTDVTLSPLPGDHAVWQDAPDVANALLAKFANV